MHQARTFAVVEATSAVLSAALTRLSADVSGDDKTVTRPMVPTDHLMNLRLLKSLSLFDMQSSPSHPEKRTLFNAANSAPAISDLA